MSKPDDDVALFRESLGDVKPLAKKAVRIKKAPPPAPIPRQTERDERQALAASLSDPISPEDALETGEALSYTRDGLGSDVLRKLRRGHWVIQDNLDLHGSNRHEARELLVMFLNEAKRNGLRCVRIVHGKGLGSKNRLPVLKALLKKWLEQREEVLAFCQALPADGGSGAAIVLLNKN